MFASQQGLQKEPHDCLVSEPFVCTFIMFCNLSRRKTSWILSIVTWRRDIQF